MRYIPPWGTSDPDGAYINGDPTIGRQGSIPPAAMMEHPQREIIAVIEKSGFVPSENDLEQLARGVRSQRLNYADDVGTTPDNLVVAYDPPLTAYTRGLVLRVRVRHTNIGPSRINAGAGTVPIRKMNGADVGPSELPVGGIITLAFDGTNFQLSNFGGGSGGAGDIFMVRIPYTVDLSEVPGVIRAVFNPPITEIGAGDIIAVQVAHTAPGPTRMEINNLPAIELKPNGVPAPPLDLMLQGDIAAGDVVQFFFDGNNLRFIPNPEITANVGYTVGAGQQLSSIDAAMEVLKRKSIGARGYVSLVMVPGEYSGGMVISHPSADRITIRGTMIGPAPVWSDFAATGSSPQQRAQDAIFNNNMLRTRYGTVINLQNNPDYSAGSGFMNDGPGRLTFADMLIVGQQLPPLTGSFWWQNGINVNSGYSCTCLNIAVWGSQMGFSLAGAMNCVACFACASTRIGFHIGGGYLTCHNYCGAFGNTEDGAYNNFGIFITNDMKLLANGQHGSYSGNASSSQIWWTDSLGNGGFDHQAGAGSSTILVLPSNFGTTSPPLHETGNLNSVITTSFSERGPI